MLPSFSHHMGSGPPRWNQAGVIGHLVAGSAYGLTAAERADSWLFYVHINRGAGETAEISTEQQRALHIAACGVKLDGQRYDPGKIRVLGAGASQLSAAEHTNIVHSGGEPALPKPASS